MLSFFVVSWSAHFWRNAPIDTELVSRWQHDRIQTVVTPDRRHSLLDSLVSSTETFFFFFWVLAFCFKNYLIVACSKIQLFAFAWAKKKDAPFFPHWHNTKKKEKSLLELYELLSCVFLFLFFFLYRLNHFCSQSDLRFSCKFFNCAARPDTFVENFTFSIHSDRAFFFYFPPSRPHTPPKKIEKSFSHIHTYTVHPHSKKKQIQFFFLLESLRADGIQQSVGIAASMSSSNALSTFSEGSSSPSPCLFF